MQHLAIIMDGNRRWAREKKLQAVSLGHKKGVDSVKSAIKFCLKNNIKYLSLYTFSLENFNRDGVEKKYLFDLLTRTLRDDLDELISYGVKVRFVGDRSCFPEQMESVVAGSEEGTRGLDKLCLNILFCYGSKQEVIFAAKKVAQKVRDGVLRVDEINESVFRKEMWLNGTPDPDLIIRTGKTFRLSNFLLFQAAYSELMFLDCYWPEVNESLLQNCLDKFHKSKRNFGK
jgi:undecaprenyl diphosphate synthase